MARVHAGNRARVTQLINKSNQFNLTTRRFTEAEVEALEIDAHWECFALRLRDRLDDHGIISVILAAQVGSTLEIALWVMSCRVIGRGVEQAALEAVMRAAQTRGCDAVLGRYLPTPRNSMVAQHYERLGFASAGTLDGGGTTWRLSTAAWAAISLPIRIVDSR